MTKYPKPFETASHASWPYEDSLPRYVRRDIEGGQIPVVAVSYTRWGTTIPLVITHVLAYWGQF